MMDTWRVNEGYPDHGIIDQHGHLIAMVTTDEDRPQEPDEVLRNAVLIAAAPELLAALRAARDDLSDLLEVADLTDEGVADNTAVLNQVIAAIAKAEGRSTDNAVS